MKALSEKEIFKAVCENSFSFFVRQYLKVLEPETVFEWNWHIDVLCRYCEAVYKGEVSNLDINIPPRMLKSLIVSVLFPVWVWTKEPHRKFLCASRSFDLSVSLNQKRRDLITSKEFSSNWFIPIREDLNTSSFFGNYKGGTMKAVSALGKVTGEGGDYLMSDDLIDAMDSFSKSKRKAVNTWFSNAWYNRVQSRKKAKRININQRLHVEDVSGHIEKNHNFLKLVIPMMKTEKDYSTVDFKDPRKVGEFIHNARYGQKEYEDEYKSLGVYGWSSQYQQQPRPIGGGIIKEEWIRYYDKSSINSFEKLVIVGDLTFKGEETSDYVSFQCWGVVGSNKYLVDLIRGKWTYAVTKEMFKKFCEKYPKASIYIEEKANGAALISDMSTPELKIKAWPPKGSSYYNINKVQRLHMVSQEYETGCVWIPKDIELAETFVEELVSFTENGSSTGHDDMVDTSTMALIECKSKSKTFFVG